MQGVPIFGKVELLMKTDGETKNKLEFDDAGMVITGDYIIIVINEKGNVEDTVNTTGKIFHISEVDSYKTHAK